MFQSIYTCFQIKLENSRTIFLSSFNEQLTISSQKYLPNSGLKIMMEETNLAALHEVIIHGIYEKDGITINDQLLNSEWLIRWYFGKVRFRSETFRLKEFTSKDLEFVLVLETKISNYNKHSLLKTFSKTCRAKFGDEQCSIDTEKFAVNTSIKAIHDSSVVEVNEMINTENYFNGGTATIVYQDLSYKFLIDSHNKNFIKLDITNPAPILNNNMINSKIKLVPSCNKTFDECTNKYNNTINFRGEPFIPKAKMLIN